MTSKPTVPTTDAGLTVLEQQIRHDLDILAFPFKPWLSEPESCNLGAERFDVVVVGAGQAGVSIAVGLLRENVRNILVIDKAPKGQEGPWTTFARMPTLRSPKYLTGPDWGIPSLTFRSWFVAQWGEGPWNQLDKIPNTQWRDYILWVRTVMRVPVSNECKLTALTPHGTGYKLLLEQADGTREIDARKVVLCTGIEGGGDWFVPDIVKSCLPSSAYAHASDLEIDFAKLAGKRVAVLGAGASAFDQAATALESGAQSVHLFTRRNELHRVQTYKHLEQAGFLGGFHRLPDEWRWRFMNYILTLREPPPKETVARVAKHRNFKLVAGAPITDLSWTENRAKISTPKGVYEADFLICGTGFTVDLSLRNELASFHENILRWEDRYAPPVDERNDALAEYPYLGLGFEFLEKQPGGAPYLGNLHLFTFGATLSQGFSGGGMNGLKYALPRLVNGIVSGLYAADVVQHYAALTAYDLPEFDLDGLESE